MRPNDVNSTIYVETASLCNAGIADGVTIRSLFRQYAKNETSIATKPTTSSALLDSCIFGLTSNLFLLKKSIADINLP